jgi:nucleoside-diphosphate-sugar epimerase
MRKDSGCFSNYFYGLGVLLLFFGTMTDLWAAAPLRSAQPYAEAALCARADVIFCEDFARAVTMLAHDDRIRFDTFNVGSGVRTTVGDVVTWALAAGDSLMNCVRA